MLIGRLDQHNRQLSMIIQIRKKKCLLSGKTGTNVITFCKYLKPFSKVQRVNIEILSKLFFFIYFKFSYK